MHDIQLNERNMELIIQTPRPNRSLCTTKLPSDKCTESLGFWQSGKILRRSSQGNPSVEGVKHWRVAEYSDFGPIERYISETVQNMSSFSIIH